MLGTLVEHRLELRELMLLEEAESCPEQAATPVERVALPTAMPPGVLLNTLAGLVERVAEQRDDVERGLM
ncbi:hypothetical protein GCM10010910_25370 [Microbacterium nanhaiense]|uniref:Uncharacterized protein n=1 Tax=Microbacterium nanhaiense TaxID=1301026 RepID=A0ABQ2N4F3_9MICO|nr:hypothetical protein GCM10010910_25370 [Microbacterium nanhaiense]